MICDDSEPMRNVLRDVIQLRPSLRIVGIAGDGNEAITEATRLQPDVILLDLAMPNRTGLAALPELRQVAPAAQIIVFSSFPASTVAAELVVLGAVRYLEKGASPDAINDAIEEAAGGALTSAPTDRPTGEPNEAGLTDKTTSTGSPTGGLVSLIADAQFRRLLSCFPGAIWVTDLELRAVAIAGSDLEALGPGESEFLGKTVAELVGGGTERASLGAHRRALGGVRATYRTEIGGHSRQGKVEPLLDGEGLVVGVVGMSIDMTELIAADHALGELAAIVASTGDAVIGKSLDGTVTSWNTGAEEMYGYLAAEMIGRPISTLIPRDRQGELSRILARIAAGDLIEHLETVRVRKDGSRMAVSMSASPVRDADGFVSGASTITRDVSALAGSEEALRRSEESYRLLFELNPSASWVFSTESHRFLAVNKAATATYGYSQREFLAMTIDRIQPDQRTEPPQVPLKKPDGGRIDATIQQHTTNAGKTIDVEIVSTTIEFEGQRAQLVLAIDVTEQRRVEDQLRQAQRLESVGSLAGGIAHDFNNTLTVIRTVSGLALRETSETRIRERLLQIDEAAKHGASLTRQLLAFSRQQVLQAERCDANAVVEETVKLLRPLISAEIELQLQLQPEPATILVDRGQLQQVIINLCVNARDAMPGGGTLNIRTANIELGDASTDNHPDIAPGAYLLLEITDSGCGIDKPTQARIFDPFFTTKASGTGLGLATVQGIVAQSGGHIEIESELGRGTAFKIYLPRHDAPVPETPKVTPAPNDSLDGIETILLVEDTDMLRPLIADILRLYGYTVLVAADGAEALDLVKHEPKPIDLLLTDVLMPNMDGRELVEALLPEHCQMNVLFMSGYPRHTLGPHGIDDTQIAFIQKPFLGDELVRKIRDVLDKRAARPAPASRTAERQL